MAFARVVSFEGVKAERIAQLAAEIEQGEKPAELPATELALLHDPDTETALAITFFDTEDDYRQGAAFLDAMPTDGTPGQRTSVTKYKVAVRVTA
jgi:hypothetical protein